MTAFGETLTLAAEAMGTLLDAETVVYTPLGGVARSVSGLVHRHQPRQLASGETVVTSLIRLRNHASRGVAASAVNTGGDTITWAPKRGGATKISRVMAIVSQDAGSMLLEVA